MTTTAHREMVQEEAWVYPEGRKWTIFGIRYGSIIADGGSIKFVEKTLTGMVTGKTGRTIFSFPMSKTSITTQGGSQMGTTMKVSCGTSTFLVTFMNPNDHSLSSLLKVGKARKSVQRWSELVDQARQPSRT